MPISFEVNKMEEKILCINDVGHELSVRQGEIDFLRKNANRD